MLKPATRQTIERDHGLLQAPRKLGKSFLTRSGPQNQAEEKALEEAKYARYTAVLDSHALLAYGEQRANGRNEGRKRTAILKSTGHFTRTFLRR
ncbi:MAG: hypothetical protein ACRD5Z_23950 [Bryobacteraceae bacterium]